MMSILLGVMLLLGAQETDDLWRTVEVAGAARRYLVHIPAGQRRDGPLPVVLIFHGGGSHPEQMRRYTGFDQTADRHGFVAVYPEGSGRLPRVRTWNGGNCCGYAQRQGVDDVAFVSALLDDLAEKENIDLERVYATGMSNGAILCYRLADQLAGRIAAIAPVAGTMGAADCSPARPVPVMHFHGTDDAFVPFAGGVGVKSVSKTDFFSVEYTLRQWRRANGCGVASSTTQLSDAEDDGTTVSRTTYTGGKADVVLIKIEGGGHTWPGRPTRRDWLGVATRDIDANELMWLFFEPCTRDKPGNAK